MKNLLISAAAAVLLIAPATSAQAHVSITPGVTATGSTTTALTAGQSGYLNFRVGHGCTLEKDITNPATGKSLAGTKYSTSAFSVEIPAIAQGTGSTVPKPIWVPGWNSKVTKDSTSGNYVVSWTASNTNFYLPDAPSGDAGGNMYFDFGIGIKWAADAAGKTVFFKSVQTCPVSVPGVKASKGKKAINPRLINIFNSWDVTDGSGKDAIADEIEHNTAPSVKVLAQ
ncbi:MAG: hypothetical protein ACKOWR_03930 [Micrococcales bacterium]